jgi:hypothetical protein
LRRTIIAASANETRYPIPPRAPASGHGRQSPFFFGNQQNDRETSMKTYTAFFFTDANYASAEIEADTPEQALALARAMNDNDEVEHFHHYDQASPVNHVEILDAISRGYGRRADGDILARICARAGRLPRFRCLSQPRSFIRAALLAGPRLASFLDQ